jgi:hypothetical protein
MQTTAVTRSVGIYGSPSHAMYPEKASCSGFMQNPLDPEGHADQSQNEADPLLNNNHLDGRSALSFIPFLLPRPLSGTRCGLSVAESNIYAKTAETAIEDFELDICLWPAMFGLRLNEPSWHPPTQQLLSTYNTLSDTYCICSESK